MPNIENIDQLIADIKAEEIMKLDMNVTRRETDCGTVGCIMGFVAAREGVSRHTSLLVAEHLGIDPDTARELCWADSFDEGPDPFVRSLSDVTKPMVLQALEDLKTDSFTNWEERLRA